MGVRGRARLFDITLAAVLAAAGVIEAAVPLSTAMGDGSPTAAAVAAVLSCSALLVRRARPLGALVGTVLPWAALSAFGSVLILFWGGLGPIAVAMYSVARYGSARASAIGAGVGAAAMLAVSIASGMASDPGQLFFPFLVLAAAWTAGRVVHRKDHAATHAERRASEAEVRSREEALVAIADERARIARELHDVIAHTITAMVVQAGAARQVVDDDPDYVRDTLDRIRRTGSEALDEMRRVVLLLRDEDGHELLEPQPGLGDLEALVDRAQTVGTRVRLRVDGEPRPLPAGAELAVYRIVQEALTNVHRHARATEVEVRVGYGGASLDVEVRDNGSGTRTDSDGAPRAGAAGGGNGLVGMRERVAAYGGRVQAAPDPAGGFRVCASLPLEVVA